MTVASLGLLLALVTAEAPAPSFPQAYCAATSGESEPWSVTIHPTEPAHLAQAEHLLETYPDADGLVRGLHRSNVPLPWRHLEDFTLVSADGAVHTNAKSTGVVSAPSGAAFVFYLTTRAGPKAPYQVGLAIEGHHELTTRTWKDVARPTPRITEERFADLRKPFAEYIRTRRPRAGKPWLAARFVRWIEADLGGGVEALMITSGDDWSAIAAVDSSGALLDVPAGTETPPGGAPGVMEYAKFEAVAITDLDADGHDEVVVYEEWYEGLYIWLVRWDPTAKTIVADLVCGDAA